MASSMHDDTWLWDGEFWIGPASQPLLRPEGRSRFAMAYDDARQRVVLFGGIRQNNCAGCNCLDDDPLNPYVRDTWEWNGLIWWPAGGGGPERGYGHAMAYDAARQRIVLYGGSECGGPDGTTRDRVETWVWDGTNWDEVTSDGPGERDFPKMAYDSARQRVVLFGGVATGGASYTYPTDTWEWDGSSWTQVAADGPPGRTKHAMAYDPIRGRVVLFGGLLENGPERLRDTWEWNGASWSLIDDSGPHARDSHAMAYDAGRQRVVLFGGDSHLSSPDARRDLWEWDGQTWARLSGDVFPEADRWNSQSLVFDAAGRTLFTSKRVPAEWFIPIEYQSRALTWAWDGVQWVVASNHAWENLALAYDTAAARPIGFGGHEEPFGFLSHTVAWTGTDWQVLATVGPPGRSAHCVAYDAQRARLVLFGGTANASGDPQAQLGDTWEWDSSAWTLAATSGPAPRSRHAMAYDAAHGQLVLFGGWDGITERGDTWLWDGAQWTLANTTGPAARYSHAMAFDGVRQRVVLTGGRRANADLGGVFADTWEWDGSNWTQRSGTDLPPIFGQHMAFDSVRERMVLLGGRPAPTGSEYGATRELASGLTRITQHPQDTTVMAGGDVTLSLVAAGSAPLTYRWRRNGQLQVDGTTAEGTVFSGTSTPTLTLTNVYPSVAGTWTCDVTDSCDGVSSSDPAEVTVICTGLAPVITAHPASAGLAAGATVVFSASAASPSPVTYRWQRNGLPLQDGFTGHGSTISGADTSTLTITQVNIADEGQYALAVSNPCGTIVSSAAVLGVCFPQWYQSGSNDRPSYTWQGRAAYDRARDRTVMLALNDEGWPPVAETWEWDGTAWTLRAVNESYIHYNAQPVYHPDRQRVVMRARTDYSGSQVAMWEWDGAAWTQYGAGGPLDLAGIAYDEARHHFVGYTGGAEDDTWTGDGAAWTLAASSGPGRGRYGPGLVYDRNRRRVVLYGGSSEAPPPNPPFLADTWEWDGSTWLLRATTGPSARSDPAIAYDLMRRTTVLFGGGYTTDPRTWEWDGNGWTVRAATGPVLNDEFDFFGSMVYDSARSRIGWFGAFVPVGGNGNPIPVGWELPSAAPPRILAGPQNTSAGAGATITLAVSAEGVAPLLYQWRKGGVALADGPTPAGSIRSGVHSETLTILNSHATDSGVYDCVVSNACGSVASSSATLTFVFPRPPGVQGAMKVIGSP